MPINLPLAVAQMRMITSAETIVYSGAHHVSGYLFFYAQMDDQTVPASVSVNVDGMMMTLWRGEVLGIADAQKITVKQTAGTSHFPLGFVLFYTTPSSSGPTP